MLNKRLEEVPGNQRPFEQPFPIVGVGASAGGQEALASFLKQLPSDSGMAFVLMQPIDPKQHSLQTELLSKATKMPIVEVQVNTTIEANHVYLMGAMKSET